MLKCIYSVYKLEMKMHLISMLLHLIFTCCTQDIIPFFSIENRLEFTVNNHNEKMF